jgi:hypothetical protein
VQAFDKFIKKRKTLKKYCYLYFMQFNHKL